MNIHEAISANWWPKPIPDNKFKKTTDSQENGKGRYEYDKDWWANYLIRYSQEVIG